MNGAVIANAKETQVSAPERLYNGSSNPQTYLPVLRIAIIIQFDAKAFIGDAASRETAEMSVG